MIKYLSLFIVFCILLAIIIKSSNKVETKINEVWGWRTDIFVGIYLLSSAIVGAVIIYTLFEIFAIIF